jgi:hypothetical protein
MEDRAFFVSPGHQELLRGANYRNEGRNVDLLLAHSLPTKRAFMQALGRVGRYSDTATRWILRGVDQVDKMVEARHLAKLSAHSVDIRRKSIQIASVN